MLQVPAKAENFYEESLKLLKSSRLPFMVGGTYAVSSYTGITRPTKDIDFFCKAGDFPKIIDFFSKKGYQTEVTDERWIVKVKKGQYFFDVIFNSANGATPVTDHWLKESQTGKILGTTVQLLPPTELIYSKVFVQDRHKYDGADIAHMILKQHQQVDWKRLLGYMEQYWEVLLTHIVNFRFVYPSEREHIPRWLLDELLSRLTAQLELPTSKTAVCRGRLFSREDYDIDTKEWGFADIVGGKDESKK